MTSLIRVSSTRMDSCRCLGVRVYTTGVKGKQMGVRGYTTGVRGMQLGVRGYTTGVRGMQLGVRGYTTGVRDRIHRTAHQQALTSRFCSDNDK